MVELSPPTQDNGAILRRRVTALQFLYAAVLLATECRRDLGVGLLWPREVAALLYSFGVIGRNYLSDSNNFLKRGWLCKGFQAGSSRSKGIDNSPGLDSRSSS